MTERLLVVLPNLAGGGAARVASILTGAWCAAGHEVHVVTFDTEEDPTMYRLAARVVRHRVGHAVSGSGLARFAINNAGRVQAVRRAIKVVRPTGVVAFLLEANLAAVLAAGRRWPVVISERNHPAHMPLTKPKPWLRRVLYPRADQLVVQTEEIRSWFASHHSIDAAVIPNPVSRPDVPDAGWPPSAVAHRTPRRAISLGRLEPQKGFDRLIDAFALLAGTSPEWELVIFGDGRDRDALARRIAEAGLTDRVQLAGATRQPFAELHAADLYVHPSRYEGFPNAVIEALAMGRCVVATDAPGGTRDALDGGRLGVLAGNSTAGLHAALHRVMDDQVQRDAFARVAPEVITRLAADRIAAQWLEILDRVRHRRPNRQHTG